MPRPCRPQPALEAAVPADTRAHETPAHDTPAHEAAARAALDAFLDALNSRDLTAWARTLHYPHVRVHEGEVTVWEDEAGYVERSTPELALLVDSGWARSGWESVELSQSSPDQVHALVRFARYDAAGERTGSFDSVYVLTRRSERWGVLARIGFPAV
ncbi:hypothetical protein ACIQOV_13240 [Kitasatospora sp. NPDC091257]|uniref:hypothetical protein n=1 Tax=Kitasatospora sp. NPDC091257 TaxID=3364084 RepID=UPI00380F9F9F